MSLFGDDPDAPSRAKTSLFDDEDTDNTNTAALRNGNASSIFADTADTESSPWGFTPKKSTGRGSVVKSLLADADVPDVYIDTFDSLQTGAHVATEQCWQLLRESQISSADQAKIWSIVSANDEYSPLARNQFNVLLALIGLAQEGEELSLDAVDERRRKLPLPALSSIQAKTMSAPAAAEPPPPPPPQPEAQAGAQPSAEPPKSNLRKPSFGLDNDPWASPEMHKGHKHANGFGTSQRTTSNFTTTSTEATETHRSFATAENVPTTSSSGASWGASNAYVATNQAGFGNAGGSSGFGDETSTPSATRHAQQPRVSRGAEELITVNLLDEKEGMFMFQHRNYEVASIRRNSKVVRRYSDFVWLLDCLHKRYPFRQLPLLPPKRVAINGNYLAADNTFIEKRRRGLARFSNALIHHPVLREEQLVVMFLTVPTELAVWRKQATISVQEEFIGRTLPATLEDSLPQNLQDTFDTVRSGIRRSAEVYINLCSLVERLCKRKGAIAAEYGRLNLNLLTLCEASNDTYALNINDVPLLDEGIRGTAQHVSTSQALLEDEARAWDEGVLEDLKTLRDAFASMRDMFDRRDRYAKDTIPQLEKRILQSEQKLQDVLAKGDGAKPGEADKIGSSITADKQSIVDQHARGVFIKECVRDEILHFQTTQYRASRLHQDWAQERVKYAELQADNFRSLVDAVENMPLGGE